VNISVDNLMLGAKRIMQQEAPYKSGNLRFNAIQSQRTMQGYNIINRYHIADYIHFLNEGTQKSNKHKGYATIRALTRITDYHINAMRGNTFASQQMVYEAMKSISGTEANSELRLKTMMASLSRSSKVLGSELINRL
jgi:acetoin utilization deacetylase AcuC-like enzyme